MPKRKHPELARRVAVAFGSYIAGVKSMDYFSRKYANVEIGDKWQQIAEVIMDSMAAGKTLSPQEISKLIH